MLNPDDFKRSLQMIEGLGSTPAVLIKSVKLAGDPDTDLDTICELLRTDGPLTADIIRISNSPYYGPSTFLGNLTSAINYIGMREVIRILHLSLAQQLFARNLPSYGIPAADYWSASVAAALVMEVLAGHAGLNQEDAYTLGILHAIGRLLINRVIEEQRFTVYWDGQQPIQDWERSAVGFDYAEAGAMLLEHWRFPETTCQIVRRQLGPEQAEPPVSMLGLLQFTRRVLALTGLAFEEEDWQLPPADPFAITLGLTTDSLKHLVATCRDDYHRILQSVDFS
jgi:HD-like signal output (HDOD) protein